MIQAVLKNENKRRLVISLSLIIRSNMTIFSCWLSNRYWKQRPVGRMFTFMIWSNIATFFRRWTKRFWIKKTNKSWTYIYIYIHHLIQHGYTLWSTDQSVLIINKTESQQIAMSVIRTHNVSGDRHCLLLPYDRNPEASTYACVYFKIHDGIQYFFFYLKKSLKIPKSQSKTVYRRRTDNTMAKRKSKKGQTTIDKTYI